MNPSVVREIEDALRRAGCGIRRRPPLPMPRDEKKPEAKEKPAPSFRGRPVTAQLLLDVVCHVTGLTPSELRGEGRQKHLARARHIYAFAARKRAGWSYPRIAKAINRADHSTVLHGVMKVEMHRAYFEPELTQVFTHLGVKS